MFARCYRVFVNKDVPLRRVSFSGEEFDFHSGMHRRECNSQSMKTNDAIGRQIRTKAVWKNQTCDHEYKSRRLNSFQMRML